MIDLAGLGGQGPLYALSGLLVGFIVGLTGVGGGSLMTPLLVLLFGFSPAAAVGTDLLFAALTKAGGTVMHSLSRTIAWPVVGWLAVGSVPATALTLLGLRSYDLHSPALSAAISLALGVALLLTAAGLAGRRPAWTAARALPMAPGKRAGLTILTGALLGFLVSLSSVGAGAFGLTILILLYPERRPAVLVGTDIAHAVPLTLLAGLGHWLLGTVNWTVLAALLIGSLPGIVLGSLAAPKAPERVLRGILAAILAVVGLKLIGGSISWS
ncbi:MAG: sulfite exporter TauE/SafE family protein [Rhodospirillales bacterium]|nr:sulfite exporter TauE/SafE family protein [Rhodospirillales bacterium]